MLNAKLSENWQITASDRQRLLFNLSSRPASVDYIKQQENSNSIPVLLPLIHVWHGSIHSWFDY